MRGEGLEGGTEGGGRHRERWPTQVSEGKSENMTGVMMTLQNPPSLYQWNWVFLF